MGTKPLMLETPCALPETGVMQVPTHSTPSTRQSKQRGIAVSVMVIVGICLAGCAAGVVIDEPEVAPLPTTEEAAPTPEPPSILGTAHESEFDVTDSEGYTFHIRTQFSMGPYQSVITNALPGFTDLVATVAVNSVEATNTTPGREARWIRKVGTWLVYPAGSRACDLEHSIDNGTGGSHQTGVPVVVEDGPTVGTSYCLGVRAPSPAIYDLNSQASSTLEILGVAEADATSLLAELNSPIAAVVFVEGGVTSPIYGQVSGTCLVQLPAIPYIQGPTSEAIYDPSGTVCG